MQEQMFSIPIPPLLAIGFLIGILLIASGYRSQNDRQLGLGVMIIGFMIPITPISWYGYWIVTSGLVLGLIEIAILAIALIIGLLLLYKGFKIYSTTQ